MVQKFFYKSAGQSKDMSKILEQWNFGCVGSLLFEICSYRFWLFFKREITLQISSLGNLCYGLMENSRKPAD